jgi:hypothetical protein
MRSLKESIRSFGGLHHFLSDRVAGVLVDSPLNGGLLEEF